MKKVLALILCALMIFSLCACGATSSNSAETTAAVIEGDDSLVQDDGSYQPNGYMAESIKLVGNETAASLYPWGTDISCTQLFEIYETLFGFEKYGGEMKAILADKSKGAYGGYDYDGEKDGVYSYTVYIYDYITDHAGNKITASDVKFSYDTQVELEAPSATPWPDYIGCEVVDDTTITFNFSREMNGLDDLTNFWPNCFVVSEAALLASNSDKSAAFVNDACGTGPYKLESYTNGSDTVLVINEDYWQKDDSLKLPCQYANCKTITYVAASESAQQILALKTGEIDYVNEVPTADLEQFFGEGVTGYNLYTWIQQGGRVLCPNCSEESICNDINMRLAIFYAIDLDGLCEALGGDASVKKMFSMFGPEQSDTCEEWATWDNYYSKADTDLAKEYLEKAGYNGETITIISEKKQQKAAEIIVNMLTEVGINVDAQLGLDSTAFKEADQSASEWDLKVIRCSAWCGAVAVSRQFLPSKKYGGGTSNYVMDTEWMDLLNVILTQDGHTEENCTKWQQMAIDNAYCMGLYSEVNNVVFKDSIQSIVRNGKNVTIPGASIFVEK